MRSVLVHNPSAGNAASAQDLIAAFAEIGWVVERSVGVDALDGAIRPETEVVVVAGGDGTIARVARRLARTSLPMAIIPMGTANNVARSLGLGVDAASAVRGLANPRRRALDLGSVHGGAEELFLEGYGVGVFAHVLAAKAAQGNKDLRRARKLIADHVESYTPHPLDLCVDGRDLSGEYILAAVMNARSLGPALGIAPDAKPDDGELDVVLIGSDARATFATHLRRAAEEGDVALPAFETTRAKSVRMRADGRSAHLDGDARTLEREVRIEIAAGAVAILGPGARQDDREVPSPSRR